MTTETKEITNEQVARALGWELTETTPYWVDEPRSCWKFNGDIMFLLERTPDFTHDLNASWKYVWPELRRHWLCQTHGNQQLELMLFNAFNSPNPAMYFTTKLMELKSVPILDITDEQAKELGKLMRPGSLEVFDATKEG